eukprot:ANDGO_02204.mRNA.1 Protein OS-9 homolog
MFRFSHAPQLFFLVIWLSVFATRCSSYEFAGDTDEKVTIVLRNKPKHPIPMSRHARTLVVRSGNAKYECILPTPKHLIDGRDDLESFQSTSRSEWDADATSIGAEPEGSGADLVSYLDSNLRKDCVTLSNGGWFVYEVCPFRHVRQFHAESNKPPTMEFYLGHYNETASHSDKQKMVQVYDGGTPCDLTGQPRRTVVHYFCDRVLEQQPHAHKLPAGIHMVDQRSGIKVEEIPRFSLHEPSTCTYELKFYSKQLCGHPSVQEELLKSADRVATIPCAFMEHVDRKKQLSMQETGSTADIDSESELSVEDILAKAENVADFQVDLDSLQFQESDGALDLSGVEFLNLNLDDMQETDDMQAKIVNSVIEQLQKLKNKVKDAELAAQQAFVKQASDKVSDVEQDTSLSPSSSDVRSASSADQAAVTSNSQSWKNDAVSADKKKEKDEL